MIAHNPHNRPVTAPRANWRGFIGVDAQGVVQHHVANAEQAARRVNRSRVSIWSSVSHGWLCGGLRWYVVGELPNGKTTPTVPALLAPAPATSIEDGISRVHEWRRRHQRRAWFPFNGRIYIQCADCQGWKAEDDFPRTSASKRCHILRESYCWTCIRRIKRDFKAGRTDKAAKFAARKRRREEKLKVKLAPKPRATIARLPKVVNPTVMSWNHVANVERVKDQSRWGREDPDRAPGDFERGRFEKARRYNPLLTWEHWQELVARAPRKPRRRREVSQ